MTKFEPSPNRRKALDSLRIAMVEKKITQVELADAADCHEKTVQNLFQGKDVRQQTLFDVCVVLGIDYQDLRAQWDETEPANSPRERQAIGGAVAPTYMGAYTQAAVDHYIGRYVTVRPAFSRPNTIVAYKTEIAWDPHWPSLLFQESERPDLPFSHRGRVYVPAASMFIHLVSLTKGAMRMVVLSQLDQSGEMRGLITTLNKQGAMYMPVSSPIVYARREDIDTTTLGEINQTHPSFEPYNALLRSTVDEHYAHIIHPTPTAEPSPKG